VAAIAYGEPRTTRDVDIVLEIALAQVDALVTELNSNGFYVPGAEDDLAPIKWTVDLSGSGLLN
jgi:hypothetical protein